MKKQCKICSAEFDAHDDARINRFAVFCAKCAAAKIITAETDERARIESVRETKWKELCPPAYQDTEIERLPNPSKAVEILAWNYGPRGLLLHGKTRKGKSRCAWLLAKKVMATGKSVRVLDSMAGFAYAAVFAAGGLEVKAWIDSHAKCGLLFFDDVFKVKLTDSFESAVFAIVDYRLAHQMPILATLNDTGATLTARLSLDRGEALVARLKESCDVIQF